MSSAAADRARENWLRCADGERVCFVDYWAVLSSKRAMRIAYHAFGHTEGVTIMDPRDGTTFRCGIRLARKIQSINVTR